MEKEAESSKSSSQQNQQELYDADVEENDSSSKKDGDRASKDSPSSENNLSESASRNSNSEDEHTSDRGLKRPGEDVIDASKINDISSKKQRSQRNPSEDGRKASELADTPPSAKRKRGSSDDVSPDRKHHETDLKPSATGESGQGNDSNSSMKDSSLSSDSGRIPSVARNVTGTTETGNDATQFASNVSSIINDLTVNLNNLLVMGLTGDASTSHYIDAMVTSLLQRGEQTNVSSLQILMALLVLLVGIYSSRMSSPTSKQQYVSSSSGLSTSTPSHESSSPTIAESISTLASMLAVLVGLQTSEVTQQQSGLSFQAHFGLPTAVASINMGSGQALPPPPPRFPPTSPLYLSLQGALSKALDGINFQTMTIEEVKAAVLQQLSSELDRLTPQQLQQQQEEERQRRIQERSTSEEQRQQQLQQTQDQRTLDPLITIARVLQTVYQQNNTSQETTSGSQLGNAGTLPIQRQEEERVTHRASSDDDHVRGNRPASAARREQQSSQVDAHEHRSTLDRYTNTQPNQDEQQQEQQRQVSQQGQSPQAPMSAELQRILRGIMDHLKQKEHKK